jgi:hypothetical protein
MNCPLQVPEDAQVLLDYGARKLDAARTATLEHHLEICPSCREFVAGQLALWEALTPGGALVSRTSTAVCTAGLTGRAVGDTLLRPFRPSPSARRC